MVDRDEADVLNSLWDWAVVRLHQGGHPYYWAIALDMFAYVRSYGSGKGVRT
jgi:hypothetical protein